MFYQMSIRKFFSLLAIVSYCFFTPDFVHGMEGYGAECFGRAVSLEEFEASRTKEIFDVLKKLEQEQDVCDTEEKNILYKEVVQDLQRILDIKVKVIRERLYDVFLRQVNNLGISEHVIKDLKDVAIYGSILNPQSTVVIEEESLSDEDVKKIKIRVKECCQKYLERCWLKRMRCR